MKVPKRDSFLTGTRGLRAAALLLAFVIVVALLSTNTLPIFRSIGLLALESFICGYVAILFHEVGHVVGATMVGSRIYTVSVMGIPIYSHVPHVRMVDDLGGYCLAVKMNPSRRDLFTFVVMGPIFSLIFAVLSSVSAIVLLPFSPRYPLATEALPICGWLAIWNWSLLAGSFLTKTAASDGKILRSLTVNPESILLRHAEYAHIIDFQGKRPKNYEFSELQKVRHSTWFPHLYPLMCYWRSMDLNQIEEAGQFIKEAYHSVEQSGATDSYASSTCFEMAMFAARFGGDFDLSSVALRQGMKIDRRHTNRVGAVAARLYSKGKIAWALSIARYGIEQYREAGLTPDLADHVREWYIRIVPELATGISPVVQIS